MLCKALKALKNEKGSGLVELVMVMLILILFGVTIYTLIYAGSDTQNKIIEKKDAQIEARIASSYVNVRLRQNDAEGKIFIRKNPIGDGNALVIYDDSYGDPLETWILFSNGILKEFLVTPGQELDDTEGMYSSIANIDGFSIDVYEKGEIKTKIEYTYSGNKKYLENIAFLRTFKKS